MITPLSLLFGAFLLLSFSLPVFAGCAGNITGNICVGDATFTGGNDLNGISNVTGTLRIETTTLTDLTGLESLTYAGSLFINGNTKLTSLNGLNSIASIGENGLNIQHNGLLTNIAALQNLKQIDGLLQVQYNDQLPNLDGLDSLTSVGTSLHIQYNGAIENINGLGSLKTTGDRIVIQKDPKLQNVDGLHSLESVGSYIAIINCTSLTSIYGLSSVTSVNGDVTVWENVDSFCPLSKANITGSVYLASSATDCIPVKKPDGFLNFTCDCTTYSPSPSPSPAPPSPSPSPLPSDSASLTITSPQPPSGDFWKDRITNVLLGLSGTTLNNLLLLFNPGRRRDDSLYVIAIFKNVSDEQREKIEDIQTNSDSLDKIAEATGVDVTTLNVVYRGGPTPAPSSSGNRVSPFSFF